MQGNITVPKSWEELNDWQAQEIAYLYLTTNATNFPEAYLQMIFVIYQKSNSLRNKILIRKLLAQVPINELEAHTQWLIHTNNFFRFPEIKGLIKPNYKLGDISIRQFSTIDTMFVRWHQDKSLLNLKRLVASIYRIKNVYDDLDLVKVAKITDEIPVKKMYVIALAYLFTRISIEKSFPVVFPKPPKQEENSLMPVFHSKKEKYIPFDKTIIAMAMDERQPLGKKQDVNNVRIFEFLSTLSESIIYHRNKEKQNK